MYVRVLPKAIAHKLSDPGPSSTWRGSQLLELFKLMRCSARFWTFTTTQLQCRRVHIGFRKMANVADHYDGMRTSLNLQEEHPLTDELQTPSQSQSSAAPDCSHSLTSLTSLLSSSRLLGAHHRRQSRSSTTRLRPQASRFQLPSSPAMGCTTNWHRTRCLHVPTSQH